MYMYINRTSGFHVHSSQLYHRYYRRLRVYSIYGCMYMYMYMIGLYHKWTYE